MSYKAEVIADNSGKWTSNSLRFATAAEAESYARDLGGRWTAVRQHRVVEGPEPANARWDAAIALVCEIESDGGDA